MSEPADGWWRNAVIYQLYVRSFADANGDGVGDLAGVRSRLGYLRDLGVDAIWFNPWYASPLADGGYDVADYRAIEPTFGTLAEAEALIAEAADARHPHHHRHRPQPRVRPARRGSSRPSTTVPARRCASASGSGPAGATAASEPPNDWTSNFGDVAWTRTKQPDGSPGDWYLHLFAPDPARPQLGAPGRARPSTRRSCASGSTGASPASASTRPPSPSRTPSCPTIDPAAADAPHPFTDRDELHDLYRSWRPSPTSYDPPRVLIGEVWLEDRDRFARYLRPDELHGAFNFDFLACPVGRRRRCEPASTTRCAATVSSAPRPPGCSPTTT